jgi:hypothetical protein
MTGLEKRFNVSRTDGRDAPGGDREGTQYFVLDPEHDRTAWEALEYYSMLTENEELKQDLAEWLDTIEYRLG